MSDAIQKAETARDVDNYIDDRKGLRWQASIFPHFHINLLYPISFSDYAYH